MHLIISSDGVKIEIGQKYSTFAIISIIISYIYPIESKKP